MRKKLLGLFLVLFATLLLVACDNNGNEEEQKAFDDIVALVDIGSVPLGDRGSITNSFAVSVLVAGEGDQNDATITWTSTNEAVAKYQKVGEQHLIVVTRPASGEENATITLTASVTWVSPSGEEFKENVTFEIRVLAIPPTELANITDIRTGEYEEGADLRLEDVIVIHKASNGFTVFDPEEKTALFVYGSDAAAIVEIGDKGQIIGKYAVNFDSPQFTDATFTKESEVTLPEILAMATEKDVADFWIEPYNTANDPEGAGAAREIAAKQSPELNTLVKFQANVRDEISWNDGKTTNYTTVLYDTADNTKFVRSYYGGLKHGEIKLLDGKNDVTIYAVAYTVRNDRVKPSTIEGSLPVQEFFVIDYVAELTDAEAVAATKLSLELPATVLEATTLTLPLTGNNETTISWESDNEAVINSTTGVVTIPEEGFAEVVLTATISKGSVTDTKEFTIAVGVAPVVTIADVLSFEKGRDVTFEGVISGFTDLTSYGNHDKVWIEDETGAITLYRAKLPANVKIGDKFKVEGTTDEFNGLKQIAANATIEFIDSDNDLLAATEVTDLSALTADLQAKRVSLTGEVVSISSDGRQMNVKVGEGTITVRTNQSDNTHQTNAKILTGFVGQTVNLIGINVDWYNGPQLLPTDAAQINFVELTTEQKVVIDITAATTELKFTEIGDLALPAKGLHFESAITYDFKNAEDANNALVDLTEGEVVALPEEGTVDVVLVATYELDSATETVEITLTIGVVVTTGEQFHETFDGISAVTSYSDGTFTGVNGVVWTYVHARNEDGYGIDGTGLLLRRANEPSSLSATFANGIREFSFEYRKAYTGGSNNRNYSVDVTHNGETTTHVLPTFAGAGTDETIHSFTQVLNLSGEVTIKIYATGADGNQQATFDNFKWTE